MWRICHGEPWDLANWPAEFGKNLLRKTVVPRHMFYRLSSDDIRSGKATYSETSSIKSLSCYEVLNCWLATAIVVVTRGVTSTYYRPVKLSTLLPLLWYCTTLMNRCSVTTWDILTTSSGKKTENDSTADHRLHGSNKGD